MNQFTVAGMEARQQGKPRKTYLSGEDRIEWLKGYDIVDTRINETVKQAKEIVSQIQSIKTRGYATTTVF